MKTDLFVVGSQVEGLWSVAGRTVQEKLWIREELLWGPQCGIEMGKNLYSGCFFMGFSNALTAQELRVLSISQEATRAGLSDISTAPSPLSHGSNYTSLLTVSGTGLLLPQDVCICYSPSWDGLTSDSTSPFLTSFRSLLNRHFISEFFFV